MRSVGGLLFALGAIVLLARKSSGSHHWGALAQLLIVLVPASTLYVLALAPSTRRARGPARADQTVLGVSALLLTPIAFIEFLHWIGASTNGALEAAGVFALAALVAAYAAARARVTYAVLLGGLSALIAWLLVWDKILDHPSPSTFRWLLIGGAAVLLCAAGALSLSGALGANELATAGGLAAVGAGVVGVVVSAVLGALGAITTGSGALAAGESASASASGEGVSQLPRVPHLPSIVPAPHVQHFGETTAQAQRALHLNGAQHLGWDVYLLVVSLALIWTGSRVRVRGLGYVGAVGLGAFLISVAVQLTRLQAGHGPSRDIVGWPLVLLLVGAGGLLAGSLGRTSRHRSQG